MHNKDVIHRDIKPENILFSNEINNDIKLIDFGLSVETKNITKSKRNVGTPLYIPPELLISKTLTHSKSSDIWSCGVLLYALLAGYEPFSGNTKVDLYVNIV